MRMRVCTCSNNLRNDLSHPNEYIRGCTLRFLCKLKEAEILEPLVPTIKSNLEHRHSFVRRNAVLAVFSIYKSFDYLMPDGPELVEKVLLTVRAYESELCQRETLRGAQKPLRCPHRPSNSFFSVVGGACGSSQCRPCLLYTSPSPRDGLLS
eukprot:6205327-Pleurochrysis_carterae.AAC.3